MHLLTTMKNSNRRGITYVKWECSLLHWDWTSTTWNLQCQGIIEIQIYVNVFCYKSCSVRTAIFKNITLSIFISIDTECQGRPSYTHTKNNAASQPTWMTVVFSKQYSVCMINENAFLKSTCYTTHLLITQTDGRIVTNLCFNTHACSY